MNADNPLEAATKVAETVRSSPPSDVAQAIWKGFLLFSLLFFACVAPLTAIILTDKSNHLKDLPWEFFPLAVITGAFFIIKSVRG